MLTALQNRIRELLVAAPSLAGVQIVCENPDDIGATIETAIPQAAAIYISQPGVEYVRGSLNDPTIEFSLACVAFPNSSVGSSLDLAERALITLNGATHPYGGSSVVGGIGRFNAERYAAGPVGSKGRHAEWGDAQRESALPRHNLDARFGPSKSGYTINVRTTAQLSTT